LTKSPYGLLLGGFQRKR